MLMEKATLLIRSVRVVDSNTERNCKKRLAYAIHVIKCQRTEIILSFHTVYNLQMHRWAFS